VNGFAKILRDGTSQHQGKSNCARTKPAFGCSRPVYRSLSLFRAALARGPGEVHNGRSLLACPMPQAGVPAGWTPSTRTIVTEQSPPGRMQYRLENTISNTASGARMMVSIVGIKLAQNRSQWDRPARRIGSVRHLIFMSSEDCTSVSRYYSRNCNTGHVTFWRSSRKTVRSSGSLQNFGPEFEGRLRALSRVQGLLEQADHESIELRALVEAELTAHLQKGSHEVVVQGPPVAVPAGSAQTLALALHELTTNAVKYGALHVPEGRLSIRWDLAEHDSTRLRVIDWRESGVKVPERSPARRGYGSELIERALSYQLKAHSKLDFGPDGVHCTISLPWSADNKDAADA
jgi:two-component sensor histidine kinase